jgi:hypothetical protein
LRRAGLCEKQTPGALFSASHNGPTAATGHRGFGHLRNLLNAGNWAMYLREGSIDAIVAEHVWEHLTH